jgi:hypothetical protein
LLISNHGGSADLIVRHRGLLGKPIGGGSGASRVSCWRRNVSFRARLDAQPALDGAACPNNNASEESRRGGLFENKGRFQGIRRNAATEDADHRHHYEQRPQRELPAAFRNGGHRPLRSNAQSKNPPMIKRISSSTGPMPNMPNTPSLLGMSSSLIPAL